MRSLEYYNSLARKRGRKLGWEQVTFEDVVARLEHVYLAKEFSGLVGTREFDDVIDLFEGSLYSYLGSVAYAVRTLKGKIVNIFYRERLLQEGGGFLWNVNNYEEGRITYIFDWIPNIIPFILNKWSMIDWGGVNVLGIAGRYDVEALRRIAANSGATVIICENVNRYYSLQRVFNEYPKVYITLRRGINLFDDDDDDIKNDWESDLNFLIQNGFVDEYTVSERVGIKLDSNIPLEEALFQTLIEILDMLQKKGGYIDEQ